jgi:hypothetical protein
MRCLSAFVRGVNSDVHEDELHLDPKCVRRRAGWFVAAADRPTIQWGLVTRIQSKFVEKSSRLATRLWVFLGMAHMSRCFAATSRPFRFRWYMMIPPCCEVTRSPVRHSVLAPPREKKRNNIVVATHARSNSILVRGTSLAHSYCMSRLIASARTNASRTNLPGNGTRMSVGDKLTCDAANHVRTRATRSLDATGLRPWSLQKLLSGERKGCKPEALTVPRLPSLVTNLAIVAGLPARRGSCWSSQNSKHR